MITIKFSFESQVKPHSLIAYHKTLLVNFAAKFELIGHFHEIYFIF